MTFRFPLHPDEQPYRQRRAAASWRYAVVRDGCTAACAVAGAVALLAALGGGL